MLDGMVSEWDKMELDLVAYRQSGVHMLRSSEDLSQLLEDHVSTIYTFHIFYKVYLINIDCKNFGNEGCSVYKAFRR